MVKEITTYKGMLKELYTAVKIRLRHRKTAKLTAKIEKELDTDNVDLPLSSVPIRKVKAQCLAWLNPKRIKDTIEDIILLGLATGAVALIAGIVGFLLFIFAGMCIDIFMVFWNMNVWLKIPLAIVAIGMGLLVIAGTAMLIFETLKKIISIGWTPIISQKEIDEHKSKSDWEIRRAKATTHDEDDDYEELDEWVNRVHSGKYTWRHRS